jgi:predicted transposase YbfD/YdcC
MDCTTGGCAVGHATGQEISGEAVNSLYQALQKVPDSRCKRGRRYPAAVVLTLLLLAKMAGEQSIAGIADWVDQRKELLAQWLPLVRAPCANTYRYICAHIDAQALLDATSAVLDPAMAAEVLDSQPSHSQASRVRHLACDGKELRGSHRLTGSGVQAAQGVLGIYDTTSGRMEALLPIEGKGYELKAFRTWLARQATGRALEGCLLTADALHTQSTVCRSLRKAGADYLLVAKRNQCQLHEDIGYLFSQPPDFWFPERRARSVTAGHGRIEVRTLRASNELNDYLADRWPGVQQVFQIERITTRRSCQGVKNSVEVAYGLTSLPASRSSPKQLLTWAQAHWRIENRSHWRRDVTLAEDRLQLSHKSAALVMAALNCIILALFDRLQVTNTRKAMRKYDAHPDQALRLIYSPL